LVADLHQARQALGARLRGMRRDAGLTGKDLAVQLGWPASKVSKIETGKQTPTVEDLAAWAQALDRQEDIADLADQIRALESFYAAWTRQLRPGMRFRQAEAARFEEQARLIRVWEPNYVPGILQVAAYARGRLEQGAALYGARRDIDEALAVRLERQKLLLRPTKTFRFVVAEAALAQGNAVRDEAMVEQVAHLLAASELTNVHLSVMSQGTVWPVHADHGFWVFDEEFVLVETLSAELRLTQTAEIALYSRAFSVLESVAVHGDGARAVLHRISRTLGSLSPNPHVGS
jgi:transcriptional regulator with XRE-family HTH domain